MGCRLEPMVLLRQPDLGEGPLWDATGHAPVLLHPCPSKHSEEGRVVGLQRHTWNAERHSACFLCRLSHKPRYAIRGRGR
jgi:hypothetical protein